MPERICEVEGCDRVGKSNGRGKQRQKWCRSCERQRWPKLAESQRANNRARRADGRTAAGFAAQLLRGEPIAHRGHHHAGMRHILVGTVAVADGLTVSRLCEGIDCPGTYEGYSWKGSKRVSYTMCLIPEHYCLETLEANEARKVK